jgi:hypothetical protein
MRVDLDLSSVYQSGSGSILGAIRLDLEGTAFPSEGWTDFVVVILGWWIEALRGLLDPRGRRATLTFMDGAYEVVIHTDRSGRATYVAMAGYGDDGKVLAEGPLDLRDAATGLARAARALHTACVERGWESNDIYGLGMATTWLEETLARGG